MIDSYLREISEPRTTNLGVRSSNLFGRARNCSNCRHFAFSPPCCYHFGGTPGATKHISALPNFLGGADPLATVAEPRDAPPDRLWADNQQTERDGCDRTHADQNEARLVITN